MKLFRLWRDPLRSARMHLLKKIINFLSRLTPFFFPEAKPTQLATVLFNRVKGRLVAAAMFEISQTERDSNFLRMVNMTYRIFNYFAESDPAYCLWLAYFMKRCVVEYESEFGRYSELLTKQAGVAPVLASKTFQLNAYNTKLCGGLHLFDKNVDEMLKNLSR